MNYEVDKYQAVRVQDNNRKWKFTVKSGNYVSSRRFRTKWGARRYADQMNEYVHSLEILKLNGKPRIIGSTSALRVTELGHKP